MNTRAEFTHALLESEFGALPEMPKHTPVLRQDKPQAACCGECWQGRKACPSPAVCFGLHRVPVLTQRVERRSAADVADDRRVQRALFWLRAARAMREAFWWVAVFSIVAAAFTVTMKHAKAADGETAATIAAAADTGTTVAAIATGAGVEANAAMAHPVAFVALSAGKILAPRLTRGMEPETRATVLRSWATVWGAAAVNNLAVLAGAGCPPCLGVAAGIALWIREGRRDPAPITAPEADAQLALAGSPEVMP